MRKSLSIVVLALVVLSACSQVPTKEPSTKEPSTKDGEVRLGVGSPVKVTIENDVDQPSVKYLWVDQEPIHARKGRHDDIVWMIQAPGYQFTAGGIRIIGSFQGPAQPLGPPPVDFGCLRDAHNPRKFTCTNTNATPGLFKYAIEVEDSTGAKLTIDPTIKNQ